MMNGPPRLTTIVANGTPILTRFIADRATLHGLLPAATVEDAFDLTFCFPDGATGGPDSRMLLHRIGIVAAEPVDWFGYPNIDALLTELNAGTPSLATHDPGWTEPERAPLILPPDSVARTIQTWFGTIL